MEDGLLQSLQRGPSGRVVQVEAHYHSDSGQNIVLWDDILDLFPDATSVLNGNVAVSRARDASFRNVEPRCIRYQPGKVLEVVMAGDLTTHHPGSSLSSTGTIVAPQTQTHNNIAQWAMSMAENTAMDEHYAPSVYSQFTDTTTRPFKPLYIPTEADEESVWNEEEQEEHQKVSLQRTHAKTPRGLFQRLLSQQPSFADDDDLGMGNNSLKEERLAVSEGENAALPDDNAANDYDAEEDDSGGWWPETPKPVKVNVGEETWVNFDKELERWEKWKKWKNGLKTSSVTEALPPPPMSHSATPVSISSPAIKGLLPLNRRPPPGPKPAFAGLPARRGAVSGSILDTTNHAEATPLPRHPVSMRSNNTDFYGSPSSEAPKRTPSTVVPPNTNTDFYNYPSFKAPKRTPSIMVPPNTIDS
ncbi:hypothetical protein BGZ89_012378 [Linnemannia elongata]|nr:hypothetical protein BGZ89_012378 [Linnemannia elongata]